MDHAFGHLHAQAHRPAFQLPALRLPVAIDAFLQIAQVAATIAAQHGLEQRAAHEKGRQQVARWPTLTDRRVIEIEGLIACAGCVGVLDKQDTERLHPLGPAEFADEGRLSLQFASKIGHRGARHAAQQHYHLARDVQVLVVVVPGPFAAHAVAGEDHGSDNDGASDAQAHGVELHTRLELDHLPPRPLEDQRRRRLQDIGGNGEVLEIGAIRVTGLEAGLLELVGDIVGSKGKPLRGRSTPFAFVGSEEGNITAQPRLRVLNPGDAGVLGPRRQRDQGENGDEERREEQGASLAAMGHEVLAGNRRSEVKPCSHYPRRQRESQVETTSGRPRFRDNGSFPTCRAGTNRQSIALRVQARDGPWGNLILLAPPIISDLSRQSVSASVPLD